jgi:membrane protein implicated in regulation of membrane protease activity
LQAGDKGVIVDVTGLTLKVKPKAPSSVL